MSRLKKLVLPILLPLLLLLQPALAYTNTTTISTTIIDTQYLDMEIWVLIVLLGFGFLILSNVKAEWNSNAPLWAIISPFFLFPAAYFSLQIQTMSYIASMDSAGTIHMVIQQTVYHPEWLALVLAIMFIFSVINIFYILTRKPVEKPSRKELEIGSDTNY